MTPDPASELQPRKPHEPTMFRYKMFEIKSVFARQTVKTDVDLCMVANNMRQKGAKTEKYQLFSLCLPFLAYSLSQLLAFLCNNKVICPVNVS